MIVKSTLLAVLVSLAILGSFAVAQAQTFTNGGVDPAHVLVLGWNFGHLSNVQLLTMVQQHGLRQLHKKTQVDMFIQITQVLRL